MELEGELLEAVERVIVTPAAGVFVAVEPMPHVVEVGSTIGYVQSAEVVTPVKSPFTGHFVSLVASTGERLRLHQRVGWLRVDQRDC